MQGFCKTCIAALFLIPLTISAAAAEWGLRRVRDGIRVFMRLCHEQRCDNLVGTTATLAACRLPRQFSNMEMMSNHAP